MASDSKPHLPMEDWIPGVLSGQQVAHLAAEDYLQHVKPEAISYSSVDLHLADGGYWLPEGSVKPFGERYLHQLKQQKLVNASPPRTESSASSGRRLTSFLFASG